MPYVTTDQSLPRSLDVTVTLSAAQSEVRTDLSTLCVAMENLGFLPGTERVRFYSTLDSFALDFALGTAPYFAAAAFFAQDPKPRQMAVGEVFLDDQPAMLAAPELSAANLALVIAISDGAMNITYNDGGGAATAELTGLNFTTKTTLAGIVEILNAEFGSDGDLIAAVKTLPGGDEILTISTTAEGDGVTISAAVDPASGTYVGTLLGLSTAGSVTAYNGYAPTGIADELQSIVNAAVAAGENIYGWCLGATLRSVAYQSAAAAWALARTAFMNLVTNDDAALDASDETDLASVVAATTNKRVACMYHDNAQQYPDVSELARMLSVDYTLKDSTLVAKFAQLPGITPVQLSETQWSILSGKGYNTYVAVGNSTQTYRDGDTANTSWWQDTVINLDNFLEDLQVAAFNVLLRNKKVPYTRQGQLLFVDAIREVGNKYIYNGSFADREKTDSTKKSGTTVVSAVQIIPASVSSASVADRAARVAPSIQIVVQDSGAMQSIALNVEFVS